MFASRHVCRCLRPSSLSFSMTVRLFTIFPICSKNHKDPSPSTTAQHWEYQKGKTLNLNSTSTQAKVGGNNSPPDLLSSVDPEYKLADPFLGNAEHLPGAMKKQVKQKSELDAGEMEGIAFKVEPLRREGEDVNKMRARLLC
jgi:hypothetical protein